MKNWLVLVLSVLIWFTLSVEAIECSRAGYFFNGKCVCFIGFDGMNCEIEWVNDNRFYPAYVFNIVLSIVLGLVILGYSINQLRIILLNADPNGRKRWNVITLTYTLIAVGSFIQVLNSAVDPDGLWKRWPIELPIIFDNLSYILFLSACFAMALYWVELQMSCIKEMQNIAKTRPILIIFIVISLVVLFPLAFLSVYYRSCLILHDAVIVILSVCIGIFLAISVYRLERAIKNINSLATKDFLQRLNRYVRVTIAFLIIFGVFFLFTSFAPKQRFHWVSLQIFLRIFEFLFVMSLAMFMEKRKPTSKSPSAENPSATISNGA
eukprot:TRINITY_DN9871_c0_g1_i1.p1 TRINITY_DN9871_c0_g1~~TRINITY_DN9871_c0_g1_i1.p1  ORF type:complete len:323 (+),score=30.62 TRINITY_DN9871_c0_g1_i1:152-1120(+)